MKKIFEKPHNLMFAASAVIFLQLLFSVICIFIQAVVLYDFDYISDYIYIAYCAAVCGTLGTYIIKKHEDGKNKNIGYVKLWFAGFFFYAFTEICVVLKMMMEYDDFTGYSDLAVNLYDNQVLYRLYLYIAVIFLIYCVLYVLEKNKTYIIFAVANLLLFALIMMFLPDSEFLLLGGEESALEVLAVVLIREAGSLIFMLNMFIFALREFYGYKEK